jgi:hypothetical protein
MEEELTEEPRWEWPKVGDPEEHGVRRYKK